MPFTPHFAIPYQTLADKPHGPDLGEKGFLAVDAAMKTLADRITVLEGGANSKTFFAISAGETTSVETFADLAGASMSFTKRAAGSKLQVTLHATFVTSSVARGVEFAVRVDGAGTDHLVAPMHQALPAANVRLHANGSLDLPASISAAAHTIAVRWRAVAGTGTVSRIIGDDFIAFTVTEVTG